MFQDKKRTVQVVDNDCAVPIFVAFPRVVFDVNSSKSATFYFYDLSSKSRNHPHYAVNCGLKTFDMTDDEFNIATTIYNNNIHLSYYDCIAYTVSKIRNWILVTGDERLRKFATKNGVQVHGFIWALQQCNLSEEKIKQILNQIASGENMRRIPLNIFLNVFFPNK